MATAIPEITSGDVIQRELVRTADTPPGLSIAWKVGNFLDTNGIMKAEAVINAEGRVAFVVPLVPSVGPAMEERDGLFHDDGSGSGPQLIAMTGGGMPGIDGRLFRRLRNLNLSDDRSLLMEDYDAFTLQSALLFRNTNGLWRVLAEDGASIPDEMNTPFGPPVFGRVTVFIGGPLLQTSGGLQTLFSASLDSFGFSTAYWGWDTQRDHPFRFGTFEEQAPDAPPGELLEGFGASAIAPGQPHPAILQGMRYNSFGYTPTVWSGPLTNLSVIAQGGDPVPAPAGNYSFDRFSVVAINAAAQTCFIGNWLTNAVPSSSVNGVIFQENGINTLVARKGDPAPGDAYSSGQFEGLSRAVINAQGQVLFSGSVRRNSDGQSYNELYRWNPAEGIVRVGFPLGPETNLLSVLGVNRFNANSRGDAAVEALASGASGIWATADADVPQLVAWSGPSLDPSPEGALRFAACRAPSSFVGSENSGGEDGRPRFFSDNRRLVYATMLDEAEYPSALYVATVTPTDPPWFVFPEITSPIQFPVGRPPLDFYGTPLNVRTNVFGNPQPTATTPDHFADGWLLVEVTAESGEDDRLGRIVDGAVAPEGAVEIDGVSVGTLSRPDARSLRIDFNANATPPRVAQLMAELAFGTEFMQRFEADPNHREPARTLQLTLSDANAGTIIAERRLEFPWIIGLQIDAPSVSYLTDSEPEDVVKQVVGQVNLGATLRLSDGNLFALPEQFGFADAITWNLTEGSLNHYLDPSEWTFLPPPQASSLTHTGAQALAFLEFNDNLGWRNRGEVSISLANHSAKGTLEGLIISHTSCFSWWTFEDFYLLEPKYYRVQFNGVTPSSVPGTPLTVNRSPSSPNPDPAPDVLPLLRALRTWMNGTTEGRRLVTLYFAFSDEMIALATEHPTLKTGAREILSSFAPGVAALLAGNGEGFVITQVMIDRLNEWIDEVLAVASPELIDAVNTERIRFHDLQDFVGQSMSQWGALLGIGAPSKPFYALAWPYYSMVGFRAEANLIEGWTPTLQRAMDPGVDWREVTNAVTEVEDYSVIFYDTNATSGRAFYRLHAAPDEGPSLLPSNH